jgi:hypothetical protein
MRKFHMNQRNHIIRFPTFIAQQRLIDKRKIYFVREESWFEAAFEISDDIRQVQSCLILMYSWRAVDARDESSLRFTWITSSGILDRETENSRFIQLTRLSHVSAEILEISVATKSKSLVVFITQIGMRFSLVIWISNEFLRNPLPATFASKTY